MSTIVVSYIMTDKIRLCHIFIALRKVDHCVYSLP